MIEKKHLSVQGKDAFVINITSLIQKKGMTLPGRSGTDEIYYHHFHDFRCQRHTPYNIKTGTETERNRQRQALTSTKHAN